MPPARRLDVAGQNSHHLDELVFREGPLREFAPDRLVGLVHGLAHGNESVVAPDGLLQRQIASGQELRLRRQNLDLDRVADGADYRTGKALSRVLGQHSHTHYMLAGL